MKGERQDMGLPAAGGAGIPALPAAVTRATPAATAAALAGTLGLAAACWVIAAWQMRGMDMGTATQLGSFGFFMAVWAAMMAAMMLPGAAPAVLRRAHAGGVRAVPLFTGSYLAVWALAGAAVYALYRPHGAFAAAALRSRPACMSSRRSSGTSAGAAASASALDSASGCAALARASG
jgi:predicted metal-binding membrane protein